ALITNLLHLALPPWWGVTTIVLDPLPTIVQRVSEFKKNVKKLKQVDHSSAIFAMIRSELPSAVNEYLGSSLGDSLQKVLQKHTEELKQELKQQESHKSATEIIKIKREQASKQKWPKHSSTPFDKIIENEYKQKDILFKMMLASKSHEKHLAHQALYDALIPSLFVDEDDMDQATTAIDQGMDKKRPRKDTQPSKKSSASKESSKGHTPPKSSKYGKSVTVEEPYEEHVHDMSLDAEENIVDETGNADEHPDSEAKPKTNNASKNDWFKQPLWPHTPDLEWNKSTPIDFSKFAKNRLKLDKITKKKPEGDRCPFDLSKPLPLKGRPGHLTVASKYFFNNDLEYLKFTDSERKYTTSITKIKAVDKLHGYGYLEEIMMRRADRKMYKFKEVKTPMVPPNKLGPDLNGKAVNETKYRGMIGSLMYLTASKFDIQFSTCLCARYQANPKESHLIVVRRIFRDLKGDIELHFIPTQYQLADIFTKPLDEPTFKRLIVELEPNTQDRPKSPNPFLPADQVEFTFDEITFTTNNETLRYGYPLLQEAYGRDSSWFATIGYNEEIGAKGTVKKSCLPPRWRLLMAQIIQCLGAGTNKKHSKYNLSSKEEATKSQPSLKEAAHSPTCHSRKKKKSGTAKDKAPNRPSVSTPVDTELHKEDLQTAGVPTSLGVSSEEGAHLQPSSDKTKSARDGLKTAHTVSGTNEESGSKGRLKTLDSLPSLLNKVTNTLMFSTVVETALGAASKNVPSAGQLTASPAKGEKNTNPTKRDAEPTNLHNELVDLLGIDIMTQYYNKNLLYDKYYDKMPKRRKSTKNINCDVFTQKGPITLQIYREDETIEVILNVKVNDLHLAE
nr:uncharacterized mitochondrial protein AtMg00810-like [Tanacetum cinerariifolium]